MGISSMARPKRYEAQCELGWEILVNYCGVKQVKRRELIVISLILVAASVFVYSINYLIFHDLNHIFLFMLSDLAFSFLEVIVVGLIIERVLTSREKRSVLYKLNMISGVFFSKVGTNLLGLLLIMFKNRSGICPCLSIGENWGHLEYTNARNVLINLDIKPEYRPSDLQKIKDFLNQHYAFILEIITDPVVLEHEEGVELLWSVSRLSDELNSIIVGDKNSLATEKIVIEEAKMLYRMLAIEWLDYMEFVQHKYPLYYKTLLHTNQFNVVN